MNIWRQGVGRRFYNIIHKHEGVQQVKPVRINLTVVNRDDVEKVVVSAAVQDKIRELEQIRSDKKKIEAEKAQWHGTWAISMLFVMTIWWWQIVALKGVVGNIDTALSDCCKQINDTETVIRKAKRVWLDKLAPINETLRDLERDRAMRARKLDQLTETLRNSLVAVGEWSWKENKKMQ